MRGASLNDWMIVQPRRSRYLRQLMRVLRAVLLFAIALAVLGWWQPRFVLSWIARLNPEVIFFVKTNQPLIALTIDDSPHPEVTPRILNVLANNDSHATFFIIGERIAGNEQILSQMVDDGHEVGNHHLTDVPSIRLTPQEFEEQLRVTDSQLAPFGGSRWFRPASGWFNRRMLEQLERYGYTCVLGSAYPEDLLSSPWYLAQHILLNARPGSIIILHDGTPERVRTLAVLERVLPELRRRGYRVVTLSELIDSGEGKGSTGVSHNAGTYDAIGR